MCEWDDFAGRRSFVRARLAEPSAALVPPFVLLAEPGFSAAEQRICSEIWMRTRLAAASPERERLDFRFNATRQGAAKLKLGYLSSDFQNHARTAVSRLR
jgi:predicted O-linked N-acetylglucosamine transferase (SPINDLY family)